MSEWDVRAEGSEFALFFVGYTMSCGGVCSTEVGASALWFGGVKRAGSGRGEGEGDRELREAEDVDVVVAVAAKSLTLKSSKTLLTDIRTESFSE